MQNVLIETVGLAKHYPGVRALDGCDLAVSRGEVFGLLGPNGAGKSTLIRLLMGFLAPSHGVGRIDGLDCRHDSLRVRERVAYLPGDVRLFRSMRGQALLRFMADMHPRGSYQRAVRLAERLELNLSRKVSSCSSGMRQKLALAATLAVDVPVVILDEPTTHLDPTARHQVLVLVREAQQAGRTVLFSSHVISEVEEVCDRVAILRAGKLAHTETLATLRRQHEIRARVRGVLAPLPQEIIDRVRVLNGSADQLHLEVPGELSPLFGWLATLPLDEISIEPSGLKSVYDRFHAPEGL